MRSVRDRVRFAESAATAALALVVILGGCATCPEVPSVDESPLPTSPLAVRFQPGDVVEVKFRYWPELNEVQTIRPDGMISLQLINEVQAEKKTPEELRQELLALYASQLKDPEITVIARVEENRLVHVGGEVNLARNSDGVVAIPLIGRVTLIEAIIKAGGLKEATANISKTLIIRRFGDKQYARTIDLSRVFKDSESEPFYLEPNDVVYVPRKGIDRVNVWIDQYLNQTVPTWVKLNYNINELWDDDDETSSSSSDALKTVLTSIPWSTGVN